MFQNFFLRLASKFCDFTDGKSLCSGSLGEFNDFLKDFWFVFGEIGEDFSVQLYIFYFQGIHKFTIS